MTSPPPALLTAQAVGVLAIPALATAAYLARVRGLAGTDQTVPGRRVASWLAGVAVFVVAGLALAHRAGISMYGTEIQHFLMGEIAAGLLVVGLTGPLLAPALRRAPLAWLTVTANPLPAFAIWALDLYVWHMPSLYQAALHHSSVQALQQLSLLICGANMWMCLLGPLRMPAWFSEFSRLGYVLAVRITGVVLANIFLWSRVVSYPHFIGPDTARNLSPVVDENLAGAIMLVTGTALTLASFAWLFARSRRIEGSDFAYGRAPAAAHEPSMHRPSRARLGATAATSAATIPAGQVSASTVAGRIGGVAERPGQSGTHLMSSAEAPPRSSATQPPHPH
jgi:cytochrome c oxidase assembly factor CtaG